MVGFGMVLKRGTPNGGKSSVSQAANGITDSQQFTGDRMPPVKVYVICPGLGHINRGFESFTQECFNALMPSVNLDVMLFKGAGYEGPRERAIFTLRRESRAAAIVGALSGKGACRGGEAISFGTSLLPHLLKDRPDVVLFSDSAVGRVLRVWRTAFRLSYKLLYSNGAPCPPQFLCWDHTQQLSPQYYEQALAAGLPPHSQTLLPYGHDISRTLEIVGPEAKERIRHSLSIPAGRKVILCVGSIARGGHKRMEYLIDEVARIPEPRPFLVILGQKEGGADQIERSAAARVGTAGFTMRTVARHQVEFYYKAADLFVLASLQEGFGRVFVEAMAEGTRCVTHDYATARYVLGSHGKFGNLEKVGALAQLLQEELRRPDLVHERIARHRAVYDRFSWSMLTPRYREMLMQVSAMRPA
jgi:glycosyltransferase involved in cell wall biosynthesis